MSTTQTPTTEAATPAEGANSPSQQKAFNTLMTSIAEAIKSNTLAAVNQVSACATEFLFGKVRGGRRPKGA